MKKKQSPNAIHFLNEFCNVECCCWTQTLTHAHIRTDDTDKLFAIYYGWDLNSFRSRDKKSRLLQISLWPWNGNTFATEKQTRKRWWRRKKYGIMIIVQLNFYAKWQNDFKKPHGTDMEKACNQNHIQASKQNWRKCALQKKIWNEETNKSSNDNNNNNSPLIALYDCVSFVMMLTFYVCAPFEMMHRFSFVQIIHTISQLCLDKRASNLFTEIKKKRPSTLVHMQYIPVIAIAVTLLYKWICKLRSIHCWEFVLFFNWWVREFKSPQNRSINCQSSLVAIFYLCNWPLKVF